MHTSKYDYLFKLLLIGDSGVGKVLLLASHTHSTPSNLPPCCLAVNESTRSPDTKRVYSRLVWPCSTPSKANESGIDSFAAISVGRHQTSLFPDSFGRAICHPPGLPTPNESGNRLVWPRSTPSKASESIPDSFAAISVGRHQTSLFPDSFGRARHPAKQASLEIDSFAPRATTICHLPSRPAESSLPPHLHFCHAGSVGSVVPAVAVPL
ncbi:hypothetical protein F5890DRAFT_1636398 [Lentinula detonsa]|uniref:Ras-domain-containing protein n=1 Tax=Lentinula detonsa TaxID=2804962 RepID=A0AA38PPS9_9AGAR|nr:hypothetical protein F5890DRAFT_1636398 [Lentinula detonsa]